MYEDIDFDFDGIESVLVDDDTNEVTGVCLKESYTGSRDPSAIRELKLALTEFGHHPAWGMIGIDVEYFTQRYE